MATIRQRVELGAQALDGMFPTENWRKTLLAAIEAQRFDVGTVDHCVIGEMAAQRVGGHPAEADWDSDEAQAYHAAWSALCEPLVDYASRHGQQHGLASLGMDTYDSTPPEHCDGEIARLEQGWAAVLRGQRA